MKKQKIGYNEEFIMYVLVDWKLFSKVKDTLEGAGFKTTYKEKGNDDIKIEVEVNTYNCQHAKYIIKQIVNP